jgi:hypothetical protein
MSTTVQNVIDDATRTYRDLDPTRALQLVNNIDEEILLHVPLRRSVIAGSSIVAGTRTYQIPETILKVWSVIWYNTSTDSGTQLDETSFDSLDVLYPNWRSWSGTPSQFYCSVDSTTGLIGFDYNPNISASGGYPSFSMDCSIRQALIASDMLPVVPMVRYLYANGVRWLHAMDRGKADMAVWKQEFLDNLAEQSEVNMQRAGRVEPQVQIVNQRSNFRNSGFRVRS